MTSRVIAPHSCHKADNNFSAFIYDSRTRVRVIHDLRQWYKLGGGSMVGECC